jgi:hypothetical protein
MQKVTLSKPSLLRILLGVYVFPLLLVVFSLGVPPGDLPLCGLMLILAVLGLMLAWRERRPWRVIWMAALILSVLCGGLEIVAGQRIARQRSRKKSSAANPTGAVVAPIARLFAFDCQGRPATDQRRSA